MVVVVGAAVGMSSVVLVGWSSLVVGTSVGVGRSGVVDGSGDEDEVTSVDAEIIGNVEVARVVGVNEGRGVYWLDAVGAKSTVSGDKSVLVVVLG